MNLIVPENPFTTTSPPVFSLSYMVNGEKIALSTGLKGPNIMAIHNSGRLHALWAYNPGYYQRPAFY